MERVGRLPPFNISFNIYFDVDVDFMPHDYIARYDATRINTTSLKGLVCLLHQRALVLIRRGLESGGWRDVERAQNLIFQLELAVDREEDASRVLADLYAYCYYLLERPDPRSVTVARRILEALAEAFNGLAGRRKGV
jgi:flagellin-specific chaperone FliS